MSIPNSKAWEPTFIAEWRRMAAPAPVPTDDPGRHPLQHVWPSLTRQSIWWRWFLWVQRLSFYMDNSRVGRLWDLFDTVLNMVQVALFIWHTTAVGAEATPIPLGLGHRIPELVLALMLLGQFVVRHVLIMGEHFSFFMLVTFLDTIPSILATCLSFASQGVHQSYLSAGVLVIFYPVRFVRLQKSLASLFSPGHNSLLRMSQVKRKLLLLASDVALTLLAVAAGLHAWLHHFSRDRLEESQREFNYFDAFFFCAVSIISGPENDVVPDLLITRLVVLLILLLAAVFLPAPIGEILGLMRGVSHYTSYTADPRTNHVIVCGNLEFTAINEFLNEFYNEDHGIRIMHTSVVVVHPNEPSEELASLLADPRYAHRVSYYRDSPTSYSVLEKLEARKAKAVFILTAKFGRRARIDDDAETVMYALALSSYICGPVLPHTSDMWNPNIVFTWPARLFPLQVSSGQTRIYAQTLLPETETHFRILKNTRILAVEEFRMGLLAQSCATEGFSTLMHLLTTTLTDKTVQRLLTALTPQVSSHELSWMTTYLQGATQEIYETRIPQAFVGLPYRSVVRLLYQKFRVVLFAVGISRRRPRQLHQGEGEFHELYLNPVNHIIRPNDLAFLVASSSEQVDRIRDYPLLMGSSLSLVSFHNPSHPGLHSEPQRQPLEDGLDMMEEKYESEEFPIPRHPSQELAPSVPTASDSSPLAHEVRPSSVLMTKFRPPMPTNIPISPLLASHFVGKVETPVVAQQNALTYSPTFEIRCKVASRVHKFSTKNLARNVRRRKRKVLQQQDPFPRDLRNHILICDASPSFPRNVEYLVQSLKTAFSDEYLPVIILSASHPPKVQALTLQDFHHVYVVEGSPLSAADLSRTYIERARGVIVLSNAKYYSNTSKRLADSTAVLFEMNLRSFRGNPLCFPVVEVLHRENIKFIDGETPLRSEERYASQLLRPSFMSGRVFIPTMLDVMLCHSYFNPHILEVYKHLIFSHDQFTTPKSTVYGGDGLVGDELQRVSPLGLVPADASDGTSGNRRPQVHTVGDPQYEGLSSPSESPCSSSSGPTSGEVSHSHTRDYSPADQEPLDFGPPPPPPSSTLSSSRPPDSSTLKSETDTGILRPSLYASQYGASEQTSGRRIYTDGESDVLAGPASPTVVKAMPPPARLKKRIRRGQIFLIPLPRAYLGK
ncbi:hypothetical protein IWQ61_001543 [Dispira simplex]|nr:hypothetical protein IWQ61_001543 [Dispira simplex]